MAERLPSAQWQPLTFLVSAPSWYDAVTLTIRKVSDGHAVLARLELGDGSGCTDAPIVLDNRPAGAWCETADQCASGTCAPSKVCAQTFAACDATAVPCGRRRLRRLARHLPVNGPTGSMEPYRRYGPALLRKAERMLQDRDEAKDVVQALFLDLLQRPDTPADLPYLYRAVTRRCLNHLRDRRNQGRLLSSGDEALRGPARTRLDERVVDRQLLASLADRIEPQAWESSSTTSSTT